MKKWLARFSYTLLILGGLLFYQIFTMYNAVERPPVWQVVIMLLGGMALISMGASGIRYRHDIYVKDK